MSFPRAAPNSTYEFPPKMEKSELKVGVPGPGTLVTPQKESCQMDKRIIGACMHASDLDPIFVQRS